MPDTITLAQAALIGPREVFDHPSRHRAKKTPFVGSDHFRRPSLGKLEDATAPEAMEWLARRFAPDNGAEGGSA